jgi:hypothetical protein
VQRGELALARPLRAGSLTGYLKRRLAAALLIAAVFALIHAATGHAAVLCDDGPTVPYTGTDDAAAQIHELRLEQSYDCKALYERLDSIETDTAVLRGVPFGPLSVSVSNWSDAPTPPASESVELGPQAKSQLDDSATAIHGDLWVLIGTLVGVQVLLFILQRMWP